MLGKRKQITLTLTQKCNLKCSYCYEENKTYRTMEWETAKEIIDFELADSKYEEYELDFFGGEPFLQFDLMKKIFEYVNETYSEKPIVFFATTNGTLVHGEIKEWLTENKDRVWCALSLDGNKLMHDINRCDSFDLIDIDFFLKSWPTQDLKMTISQETLPYLSDGIIYLHEKNFCFTANLAYNIDWSNPDNEKIIERELMKLIDYYIANPSVQPCSLFTIPIFKIAIENSTETLRQCGAGLDLISYDVDGKAYPCQFFMPLSAGDKAKTIEEIEFKEMVTRDDLWGDCKTCIAAPICHTCYGANFLATGNIFRKDDNWCKLQKIIFKANAFFKAKQFELGVLSSPEEQTGYLLKSILMLLNDFA